VNTDSAGLASSALGVKRALAIEWGCGLYLPERRLVITKEIIGSHIGWNPGGGSMLGSFLVKPDTFLDKKLKTPEELAKSTKKLDIDRLEIISIKLKKPGIFLSGFAEFSLQSGKNFKLFVADQSIAYSEEAFAAIKEIVSAHFPLPVIEN
jgi:hypothetical protein